MPSIALTLDRRRTAGGLSYQRLHIELTAPDRIAHPTDLRSVDWPSDWEKNLPVVIEGRGSNWMYAHFALRVAEVSPNHASWLGCYDPQLDGAVVVHSGSGVDAGRIIRLGTSGLEREYAGELLVSRREAPARNGVLYQCLDIDVAGQITPATLDSLVLPPDLDLARPVVIWGAAPLWLYAHIALRCRAAPWVGCYNIQNGSIIVVGSRDSTASPGDAFQLVNRNQCHAILIGGPPNSGKSVLCASLDRALPDAGGTGVHLHRATVDGEGDWFARMTERIEDLPLAEELRRRSKGEYSDRFFLYHSSAVANAREAAELVLVDFGGVPKAEDVPLLHRCSHYIVISRSAEQIPGWHDFCARRGGLKCLAVIRSTLEQRSEVLRTRPYLELLAGPWVRGQTWLPRALLQRVLDLLPKLNS